MVGTITAVIIFNFILTCLWITCEALYDPKNTKRSEFFYACMGVWMVITGLSLVLGLGFVVWKVVLMVIA